MTERSSDTEVAEEEHAGRIDLVTMEDNNKKAVWVLEVGLYAADAITRGGPDANLVA
jgi:hypothetical protein